MKRSNGGYAILDLTGYGDIEITFNTATAITKEENDIIVNAFNNKKPLLLIYEYNDYITHSFVSVASDDNLLYYITFIYYDDCKIQHLRLEDNKLLYEEVYA